MPDDEKTTPAAPDASAAPDEAPDTTGIEPPSASISKERAHGQDSRATAHTGEDPTGPSTRITEGRRIAERLAEHEAEIQHKNVPKGWERPKK
jgi:hypothetical protein